VEHVLEVGLGVAHVHVRAGAVLQGGVRGVVLPHTHHYQLAALIAIVFATIVFMIVRRVRTS
jgi:hypothetical protein